MTSRSATISAGQLGRDRPPAGDDRSIRVLHLIVGLGTGGAEVALLRLASGLIRTGVESRVITLTSGGTLESSFHDAGVAIDPLAALVASPSRLRAMRRWRPDVLMAWMPHAHAVAPVVRRIVGAPRIVFNVRQTLAELAAMPLHSRACISIAARASRSIDAVVYNSERGRLDHVAHGYAARRELVIGNGFVVPEAPSGAERLAARRRLLLPEDRPVVLFVGRDHPDKGFEDFLRAAVAHASQGDATYVVAGRGFEADRAGRWSIPASIADRFRWLGERRGSDLTEVWRAGDLFASTSITEAFSNAVGEAMSFGVIPVVTDVGDSARIVGDRGVVVPPRRPDLMAAAWREVLSLDPAERARRGGLARERIRREFSLDAVVDRYASLLRELVAADHAA